MTDVSAAVHSIINVPDVTNELDDSKYIFPDELPQSISGNPNAVVYWIVSGTSEENINGNMTGLAEARVTVACYSDRRGDANNLADRIRKKMVQAAGTTKGGIKVRLAEVDYGPQFLTDRPTDGNSYLRYITTRDYRIHYIEDYD